MKHNDYLKCFYQMLHACYGLCSWEFDEDLNIMQTNSVSQYLHSTLLFGLGRREAIMEHAMAETVPLIISDSVGLMWACVFQQNRDDVHSRKIYALGPIYTGSITSQTSVRLLEPLNLSVSNKWELIEDLQYIPLISTVVFFQHVIALHYYVTGQKIRVSDFVYHTPRQEDSLQKRRDELEEKKDIPHAPLMTEKMLMDMVRTGNLEYHNALAFAGSVSPGIRTKSSDPIQQAKYSVVAFITLCTRAAIEGGLSSEYAYTLSDTYTECVDNCKTISEIAAVSHTMYDDFIRRVNQTRRESGISRPIRICCDYIDTHATDELELEDLAKRVGYTEYYLSRKFKGEMGMTVNAYIRNARIRQAKIMLLDSSLTIQEISEKLHFCSRSYFADVFQKTEGISPSDYRLQGKNQI